MHLVSDNGRGSEERVCTFLSRGVNSRFVVVFSFFLNISEVSFDRSDSRSYSYDVLYIL